MKALAAVFAALLALNSGCNLLNQDDEFKPRGTPFTLNPDITVSALLGSDTGYSPVGMFNAEMRGRSRTGQIVEETLVGGLFFIPGTKGVQNLIIIKPQIVRFGPAETTYVIGCFCCNSSLSAPDPADRFTIGPVTDNADLRKIVNICADRDITFHTSLVQDAVWQVTDGSGLTRAMEDSLRAMPPDTLRTCGKKPTGVGPALPRPDIRRLKAR
uniref:Uncharacterized protein n=1 Tax=candidate division WOR-3 bacterium TaxID=2052148 RepID=A0A7C4GDG3_UNCW3